MKHCLKYDHLSITGTETSDPEILYIHLLLLWEKKVKQHEK